MKILLDTHTFLWLDGEPSRIPPQLLRDLADLGNQILVSAVSASALPGLIRTWE
ncbi:MAG: hypothetical protein LBI99_10450 [Propionibacteriaceae bacterium]|jgi:PIN domain nuclease of toxin-antitoxin system|nr:hypothetical protein [Propionibacteriaceae bacterium]